MDETIIKAFAQVLDDVGNRRINSSTAKSKIATILNGKSLEETLCDLNTYVMKLPGKEKEKVVIIAIMALLRFDLDSGPALVKEIHERSYQLAGPLYGGLAMLLSGRVPGFTFQFSVLNRDAKNAYAEIMRWNGDYFWPHIELYRTAKLLNDLDPCRFEQLAQKDPNGVLLLSMVQWDLSLSPSDILLKKLLESSDPFHPNFALAFYTQPISMLCDKAKWEKPKRGDIRKLNEYVGRCLTAIQLCNPSLRAELLTNYLLVHPRAVPDDFARQLVGYELQAEFAHQIAKPGKIRTIQGLGAVAYVIAKTPACDEHGHRISKKPLAEAMLSVLARFVRERTGIYIADSRWLEDAKMVLYLLTTQQRSRFKRLLDNFDSTLMISPLDKLVRYKLYLEDNQCHQIIQGLQNCLSYFS